MPKGPLDAPGNFAPEIASAKDLGRTERMLASMAAEVAELPPAAMRRLLPILHDARKELRAGLLAWLSESPDGAQRFTAQAKRSALLNLEAAIAKIRELEPAMASTLIGTSKAAGELSLSHLHAEVSRMSTVFGESLFSAPQIRAARVLSSSQRILIPRHENSASRYAGIVLGDIQHQLGVGVSRGETYFQLQQRLRRLGGPKGLVALQGKIGDPGVIAEEISEGLFSRYRHWAHRVVRTEMSGAYALHHVEGVRELNDQIGDLGDEYLLRWDARNDGQCPICRALDGTAVRVGEAFAPGIYRPPAHPNAVLEGSAFVPYGGLREVVRARYDGPAVVIKAGEYETTIGPNHPMLTSRGMLKAADLRKGDKLVRDTRSGPPGTLWRSGELDLKKIPRVQDAFQSLVALGSHTRVASPAHDLHGDRVHCHGEVQVVDGAHYLLVIGDSEGIEQLREMDLMGADPKTPLVSGLSPSFFRGDRVHLPAPGGVGGPNSWVATDHFRHVSIDSVSDVHFSGWAFDATTAASLYCSDGFVVSNCLCRVGAWRKDWGDIEGEVALKGPAPGADAKDWPPTTTRKR